MSLEEIETRLGPLFEPEVITNLKSANWKERLEGETRAHACGLLTALSPSNLNSSFKKKLK